MLRRDALVNTPTPTMADANDAHPREAARAKLVASLFDPDPGDTGSAADESLDASLRAAGERAERAELEARLGSEIGPYRLTAVLGRGGMGAVFAAERSDGDFQQRVALKLVRDGASGARLAARFRRERAILARLEHPGIARLIDGGLSEQGEPWFAMERVEGESLSGYCERHALSLAARLRLFLEVCEAVAYAHLFLVVHRDLKPHNVMVTTDGRAKLLDFGIAKMLVADEQDGLTRAEERVHTPDYAAPEQILGEPVTTATDVYALGLLLYEMLTGQRAQRLNGLSALESARVVVERDAPRPSTSGAPLAAALEGDLDAIVGKALRKEAARRYPGAQSLADDIGRYLDGYTVSARADLWSYRAGKFVRRHRLGILAGTATVLALVAGLVASLWQASEARLQARRAQGVKEFVTDLFQSVDPKTGRRASRDTSAYTLLQRGAERLRTRLGEQPEDHAELLLALSDLYWAMGEGDEALALSNEALAILREAHGEGDVRLLPAVVRAAAVRSASGRPEALAMLAEADALLARAGPQYDAERLRIEQAHQIRANRAGDFKASEAAARRILALQERRYGVDSPEYGIGLTALAWAYGWQNRYDEAEATYRRALTLLREDKGDRVTLFGGGREQVNMQLGNIAAYRGRYAEAEREFRIALDEAMRRYGVDHIYLRSMRTSFAYNRFNLGHGDEAEALLREELARTAPDGPEFQRSANWSLGRVLTGRGKSVEAVRLLRGAFEMTLAANGPQAKLTQFIARDLGAALVDVGNHDEAGTVLTGALEALERIETRASYHYALVESRYARLLLAQGDAAGAEARARHAHEVLRERIGDDYDETARAAHELGRALVALGRSEGIELLRAAALDYERHFGAGDLRTADYQFVLGEALLASHPAEARPMLDSAADVLVKAEDNVWPSRARAERWRAARSTP